MAGKLCRLLAIISYTPDSTLLSLLPQDPLTEAIDTNSPSGRMMMQIVGTFAEFERAMLRERTRNGLDEARKRGRVGGRRPKLKTSQQKEVILLVNSGQKTAAEAARLFNGHPSTVSRLLKRGRVS